MSNLKTIRRAAGLTQIQLAQRARVSRFRLCMAESGSLDLRPDEMAAIADAVRPEMERTAEIACAFNSLVNDNPLDVRTAV